MNSAWSIPLWSYRKCRHDLSRCRRWSNIKAISLASWLTIQRKPTFRFIYDPNTVHKCNYYALLFVSVHSLQRELRNSRVIFPLPWNLLVKLNGIGVVSTRSRFSKNLLLGQHSPFYVQSIPSTVHCRVCHDLTPHPGYFWIQFFFFCRKTRPSTKQNPKSM